VSRYQKGKNHLDFSEARGSEWHWHQLGHMQVCTLLQTDNHASIPPLGFYRPDVLPAAQSIKALKAIVQIVHCTLKMVHSGQWTAEHCRQICHHPFLLFHNDGQYSHTHLIAKIFKYAIVQ